MITKIQSNECLKRYDNMTATEREAYLGRVGEWLEKQAPLLMPKREDDVARFQNAVQCSGVWNDAECRAWTEGVRLLTALVAVTDTWLPEELYSVSAKRSVRKLISELSVVSEKGKVKSEPLARRSQKSELPEEGTIAQQADGVFNVPQKGQKERKEESITHNPSPTTLSAVPVRPKHIDQYVHLLPKGTQERAAMVKGLLRDLDVARENARKLMEAGEHGDKIAQWAKAATKLDAQVKGIYKELDREWEKVVRDGRVTVDDFGNAHIVEVKSEKGKVKNLSNENENENSDGVNGKSGVNGAVKKKGRPTMTEEEKVAKQEERDAKRREYLKKWLRDTRTQPSEERTKQWKKNCKELLKLGGEVTESIRKAGEFYGVSLEELKVKSEK